MVTAMQVYAKLPKLWVVSVMVIANAQAVIVFLTVLLLCVLAARLMDAPVQPIAIVILVTVI